MAFFESSWKKNNMKNPHLEKNTFKNILFCSWTYKPANCAALQHIQELEVTTLK